MTPAILETDAADAALSLELHPWSPDSPLAQSLSSMAARNLYGREDDADRFPGILGISVDGTKPSVALLEMDGGNGSLCPSQSEEQPLALSISQEHFAAARFPANE